MKVKERRDREKQTDLVHRKLHRKLLSVLAMNAPEKRRGKRQLGPLGFSQVVRTETE